MAMRWWWSLTKIYVLVALPVFIVFCFLPTEWMWLQMLIVWWLKPLYERPLLLVLSRAVFGESISTMQALKASPKLFLNDLIMSLTIFRLSPSRSVNRPVAQLEGLKGSEKSRRLTLLHRQGMSPASWLTIVGIHMEAFIGLGIYVLIWSFIPQGVDLSLDMDILTTQAHAVQIGVSAIGFIAMVMVAPFYVAAGFALYLNRRIHLEAWDIEILFRRIMQKRTEAAAKPVMGNASVAAICALVLGFILVSSPSPSYAQNEAVQDEAVSAQQTEIQNAVSEQKTVINLPTSLSELDRSSSKALIDSIKAQEDFGSVEKVERLKFDWGEKEEEKSKSKFWKYVGAMFAWLAGKAEIIFWFCVLALVFFVVIKYRRWWQDALQSDNLKRRNIERPRAVMGLDVTEESMPEDIGASATQLLKQGDLRAALALLYRASLFELITRGLELESSYTELECLDVAQRVRNINNFDQDKQEYFSQLTIDWRKLAYGHIEPSHDKALEFCEHWNRVWRPGAQGVNHA